VIEIGDVKRSAGLGEARDNVSWNPPVATSSSSPCYSEHISIIHEDKSMTISLMRKLFTRS
jgi:hypothetical protein